MAKKPLQRKEGCFADKYAVVRVLGKGGMGTIFEARHTRLGHRVAIKVLADELCAHPELVERFEREARSASALSSPRAVRIFDVDQTDEGVPFMVMELWDGRDLGQVIAREGPQPVGKAVRWIIEACDAIAEAHALGIIHRDIKPSNLFLAAETGKVKVLDFGIAKRVTYNETALTGEFVPLGTPQYMSPEQARCLSSIDARTDIWSLGVTLYELLCGRPPFDHELAQACIVSIVVDPVPVPQTFRPDLPDALCAVLMRALERDPEHRFASIEELVAALRPFADEVSSTEEEGVSSVRRSGTRQRLLPLAEPAARPRRHGPTLSAAMATAMLLGLGLTAIPKCVGGHVAAGPPPGAALVSSVSTPQVSAAEPQADAIEIGTITVVRHPAPKPAERQAQALPRNSRMPRMTAVHGGLSNPGF